MKRIEEHINHLFRDIPQSEEKQQLIRFVVQNLEEKVDDLVELGKSEEDAINKALVEFGDAEDIKKEFKINDNRSSKMRVQLAMNHLLFSIIGSTMITLLFVYIDFSYNLNNPRWFVYVMFAVLWWPLSVFFVWLNKRNK